ncbi:MAG: PAS domain S-box protein [Proteobacteria bacterium]|nr:PAS domain S-box protein [Pseudomonadota bacterium]
MSRSDDQTGQMPNRANQPASRMTRLALLIGGATIAASVVVGSYAYMQSRESLIEVVFRSNLNLARILSAHLDVLADRRESIDQTRLTQLRDRTEQRYQGSYFCVVGPDGTLIAHTAQPDLIGRAVVPHTGGLLRNKRDWVGRLVARNGQEQIAAFAYSDGMGGLAAVHVPTASVDAELRAGALPWALGLGFISLCLFPLALGVLHRGYALTQRALSIREARLDQLIETTQDAVIFIDWQSRIVRVNRAVLNIFGYSESELIGQPVEILMAEPHASKHANYLETYQQTGQRRAIGQIRPVVARRKNGEEVAIELSVTELTVDNGVRYAACMRDISKTIELQQKLVDKERLAAIGMTASIFAHEVGNPLNNMVLHSEVLERRVAKMSVADKLKGGLLRITDEIKRLRDLLSEFRSLSRRDTMHFESTDVGQLIAEVLDLQTQPDSAVEIQFARELVDQLPPIHANRDKLKQVLVNLCKNAIEAMPEGGTLTVRAERVRGRVQITVSDTGVGIADGTDPFQPFRTTKPDGTGLGLAIVQQIIHAHGGTISFFSQVGRGTTFTVMLPEQPPGMNDAN